MSETSLKQNAGVAAGGHDNRRSAVYFEKERGVTDVRVLPGVAHVTVSVGQTPSDGDDAAVAASAQPFSPNDRSAPERLAVLEALAQANVPVFLAKIEPQALSFAVRSEAVAPCETILAALGAVYDMRRDLGLVTVHAGAMRDLTGVMATIYDALVSENIALEQTGDAYNAVLCLVAGGQKDADRAALVLRRSFALEDVDIARLADAPADGKAAA